MSQYIRFYRSGGNYFFTLVTYQRSPIFEEAKNVEILKISINKIRKKFPFSLDAIVILPDHLHCLMKLPENDNDFSTRLRLIKRDFSKKINAAINQRNEKTVWQRRFWEHLIRDEDDWRKHMDYIHYNPVKHGLVKSASDWPHSSFHYYVQTGLYKKNEA